MGKYESDVERVIDSAPVIVGDTTYYELHVALPEEYREIDFTNIHRRQSFTFPQGNYYKPRNQLEVSTMTDLDALYADFCQQADERIITAAEQQWRVYHTGGHVHSAYAMGAENVGYALNCYRDYVDPRQLHHSLRAVPHGLTVDRKEFTALSYVDPPRELDVIDFTIVHGFHPDPEG
jgi:hypothetical protein